MKRLCNKKGMTLVELTVTMLLLLVFMSVAATVLAGISNSVAVNVRLDKSISIAQTALQTIDANISTADASSSDGVRCRGGGSYTEGPRLEYRSREDGCYIIIGTGNGDTVITERTDKPELSKKSENSIEGCLEKRYYVVTNAKRNDHNNELYQDLDPDDGVTPYAFGITRPLARNFYMDFTVATRFELHTTADNKVDTVTATVTVSDPDGRTVTEQSRTIPLVNTPPLMAANTMLSDDP